ncbi:MAG: type II toxin-antitoxin system PemK/MazF family toxin [Oscillospiraceae bacterium]
MIIKRGDIYYANLDGTLGSEQGGIRPVLVVQNDIGNKFSPTLLVAPITSKNKTNLKTHLFIDKEKSGLKCDSIAMMEQIRTIDRCRLMGKVGEVKFDNREDDVVDRMDEAIMISFGITVPRMQSVCFA